MARIHHLQRNLLIISKIKSSPYISFQDLTAYLEREFAFRGIFDTGLSRRTIQRDIRNIRTEFSIDIEYSRQNGGYYIPESEYHSDMERFLDSFDILSLFNDSAGIPEFVFTEKHRPMGTQHLHLLIYAIKNSLKVEFTYLKFQNDDSSVRLIEPYAIKEYAGRWYLIGRTSGLDDLKTYGLDRIHNLTITDHPFISDETVNINEKFKYSFGIYSSDEYPVEDVVLSFAPEDGRYLKSLPLHRTQEILSDTDTEFTISLRLKITEDFVMEIISRSWSIKVLKPQSLKERLNKIWCSALQRNT